MPRRKLHADPRSEERYHEILAASLRLFAKYGYEKTSIDRLAREVKATKGLVYYYFRSKEAILAAMVKEYDFTPAIAAIGHIPAEIPAAEALALIIRGSMRLLDSRVDYVRFLYTEGQFLNRQNERLMRTILDKWEGAVADFLRARIAAGELRAHDPALAAEQVTDAVLAFFIKTRVIHPALAAEVDGRAYLTQWVDAFLNGFAAR
jgi:AcrR family transcriptional regulator